MSQRGNTTAVAPTTTGQTQEERTKAFEDEKNAFMKDTIERIDGENADESEKRRKGLQMTATLKGIETGTRATINAGREAATESVEAKRAKDEASALAYRAPVLTKQGETLTAQEIEKVHLKDFAADEARVARSIADARRFNEEAKAKERANEQELKKLHQDVARVSEMRDENIRLMQALLDGTDIPPEKPKNSGGNKCCEVF